MKFNWNLILSPFCADHMPHTFNTQSTRNIPWTPLFRFLLLCSLNIATIIAAWPQFFPSKINLLKYINATSAIIWLNRQWIKSESFVRIFRVKVDHIEHAHEKIIKLIKFTTQFAGLLVFVCALSHVKQTHPRDCGNAFTSQIIAKRHVCACFLCSTVKS